MIDTTRHDWGKPNIKKDLEIISVLRNKEHLSQFDSSDDT